MALAHAAAAVGAAWWLRRGERLAARLLSLLLALAAPLLSVLLVVVGGLDGQRLSRLCRTGGTPWADRDVRVAGRASPTADPVSRRGPPRPAAA